MDYIIADPYVIKPEEEKFYTEKILRLPSIWSSHSGLQIERKLNETPMKKNNYITFCSFNNFSKISELNIKTWSKALRKIKNSKLLLKPSGKINYQKLYKMHHLDGFITYFGYYVRDYISEPISKIFTYSSK